MKCVDLMGGKKSTFIKHFVPARQFSECFIFTGSEILHCIIFSCKWCKNLSTRFLSVQHGRDAVLILIFLKLGFYSECILREATV